MKIPYISWLPMKAKAENKREIAVNSRAQRKYLIPRRRALFDIEIAFEEIAETLPLETWNKFLTVFDEYGRICAEEGAEEFGSEDAQILAQTLSDIFNFEQFDTEGG